MNRQANELLNPLSDHDNINFELLCIWVAITSTYMIGIFPMLRVVLGKLVVTVLDAELTDRESKKNPHGLLSAEGRPLNGSDDNKTS